MKKINMDMKKIVQVIMAMKMMIMDVRMLMKIKRISGCENDAMRIVRTLRKCVTVSMSIILHAHVWNPNLIRKVIPV